MVYENSRPEIVTLRGEAAEVARHLAEENNLTTEVVANRALYLQNMVSGRLGLGYNLLFESRDGKELIRVEFVFDGENTDNVIRLHPRD